jgi:hypothetical protein
MPWYIFHSDLNTNTYKTKVKVRWNDYNKFN